MVDDCVGGDGNCVVRHAVRPLEEKEIAEPPVILARCRVPKGNRRDSQDRGRRRVVVIGAGVTRLPSLRTWPDGRGKLCAKTVAKTVHRP